MIIKLTNKKGIILKTADKYCTEDIIISPDSDMIQDDKVFKVRRNGKIEITPDEGHELLSKVVLDVNVPIHTVYGNAKGVAF